MTEIFLPSDSKHSFTCILSSMNIAKYDEWKDTDAVFLAVAFLDAVCEEFIQKAKLIPEMECAVRFTEKARALALGALGFHTYLQSKDIEYGGLVSRSAARIIFGQIKAQANTASLYLGQRLGVPEWCAEAGYRNLTRTGIAPNRNSSMLAEDSSEGVMEYVSGIYINQSAKGTIEVVNPVLKKYLASINKDNDEVWLSIFENKGSVQHLDFIPERKKEIFKTRFETNQLAVVELFGVIQEYIDQGISCNLSFLSSAPAKYIYETHVRAWEVGLKSIYYIKSESAIELNYITEKIKNQLYEGCVACEG